MQGGIRSRTKSDKENTIMRKGQRIFFTIFKENSLITHILRKISQHSGMHFKARTSDKFLVSILM